jgi:rhodanese-related sulfurtransferase
MSLWHTLKQALGGGAKASAPSSRPASTPEPEPVVPEISVDELLAQRANGNAADLLLLDCREPWEWRQVRIPGSLHIPMNETPFRLDELDRNRAIIVVCAHGNRSYGVAGYLLQHGFHASSLRGGIAAWQARGGEVESDATVRR